MDPLIGMLDLLVLSLVPRRTVFWLLVAVIVLGLVAVAANMMEPGRPSF
jgi:hypothetical protein